MLVSIHAHCSCGGLGAGGFLAFIDDTFLLLNSADFSLTISSLSHNSSVS